MFYLKRQIRLRTIANRHDSNIDIENTKPLLQCLLVVHCAVLSPLSLYKNMRNARLSAQGLFCSVSSLKKGYWTVNILTCSVLQQSPIILFTTLVQCEIMVKCVSQILCQILFMKYFEWRKFLELIVYVIESWNWWRRWRRRVSHTGTALLYWHCTNSWRRWCRYIRPSVNIWLERACLRRIYLIFKKCSIFDWFGTFL